MSKKNKGRKVKKASWKKTTDRIERMLERMDAYQVKAHLNRRK